MVAVTVGVMVVLMVVRSAVWKVVMLVERMVVYLVVLSENAMGEMKVDQ